MLLANRILKSTLLYFIVFLTDFFYILSTLYTLCISNCSQLTAPLSVLQHPCGLSEALCQKCNSDLCCCFSCFCAGPERAVHTTRDSSPSPRQPDPSHREERYIHVNRPTYSSVVCRLPVFPPTCACLPPAICLLLSCQHLRKCRHIDMWIQSGSHTDVEVHTKVCAHITSAVGQ